MAPETETRETLPLLPQETSAEPHEDRPPEYGPYIGGSWSPDAQWNHGVQQNPSDPTDVRTQDNPWTPNEPNR